MTKDGESAKEFARQWQEATEFFKTNMPELGGVGSELEGRMQKAYKEAGAPYGEGKAGMLRWFGERMQAKKR